MINYDKKTEQDFKLLAVNLFLQKAVNGGTCKIVERKNMNQEPKHFNNANFDGDSCKLTIEFEDETREVNFPKNFGIEMVEPENNPDYKGYQRMGIWDNQSMYMFDAQW